MAAQDEQLVRRALGGSQRAYAELVQRYQRPIFALVLRMVRNRPDAEDVAQEVFVKAFRALSSFDPSKKFSSWIFKIAHNSAIDHLRRQRMKLVPLETPGDQADPLTRLPDDAATPEETALSGDLARSFEEALGTLRPRYREVMVLRFQEGLAYDEIAEITGLPLGTVKTHLHRARKALAKRLEEMGWRPAGKAR